MKKTQSNPRYDSNGNPCNFTDEDGIYFRYVGSKDGWDHWEGSPSMLLCKYRCNFNI